MKCSTRPLLRGVGPLDKLAIPILSWKLAISSIEKNLVVWYFSKQALNRFEVDGVCVHVDTGLSLTRL